MLVCYIYVKIVFHEVICHMYRTGYHILLHYLLCSSVHRKKIKCGIKIIKFNPHTIIDKNTKFKFDRRKQIC